jgi:hypothetical protein
MTMMSLRPLLEWEQARPLIAAAVVHEGFPSLTAYGDTLPQADLLDLACMFAIAGVHSGHLAMGSGKKRSTRASWRVVREVCWCALCARDFANARKTVGRGSATWRTRSTSGGASSL